MENNISMCLLFFCFCFPSCPPVIITVARNANQFGRLPPSPLTSTELIAQGSLEKKTKKLFVKKHRWILDDLLRKLCNGDSHSECLIHVYLSNNNPVLPFNVLFVAIHFYRFLTPSSSSTQGQHRPAMRTCYTIHAKCLGTTSFFVSFSFFFRSYTINSLILCNRFVCRAKDNDKFLALEKTFAFVSRTEEEEDLYGFNFVVLVFFLLLLSGGKAF
jgi:hypothetical protein